MGEHSPTPWRYDTHGQLIMDAKGAIIGGLDNADDDVRAIRCVNSHDDLVKALEEFVNFEPHPMANPHIKLENYADFQVKLRDALSKAKAGA